MYSGAYFLTVVELLNQGCHEERPEDRYLFNALRRYVPGLKRTYAGKRKIWRIELVNSKMEKDLNIKVTNSYYK
jgi:hypothetical protein